MKNYPFLLTCKLSKRSSRPRNESGGYLVLISFFVVVLVGLCALVMGLGFISTGKARLQAISNIASLAALEAFIRSEEPDIQDKADAAVARANHLILRNSTIPGIRENFDPIGIFPDNSSESGTLTFGTWFHEPPQGGDPCSNNYPCFIGLDALNETSRVNATMVEIKTSPNNPMIAPFAKFFGLDRFYISATGLATVIQRCTAYLLDTSVSVVQETHISPSNMDYCYPYGRRDSQGVFIDPFCSIGGVREPYTHPEQANFLAWCTQCGTSRANAIDDDPSIPGIGGDGRPDCGQPRFSNGESCPPYLEIRSPITSLFAFNPNKVWRGDLNVPSPIALPDQAYTEPYYFSGYSAGNPPFDVYSPNTAVPDAALDTPAECFFDVTRSTNNAQNRDFLYWCNLARERSASWTNPVQHARNDYYIMNANNPHSPDDPWRNYLIDNFFGSYNSYWGPQPLSRFFLAFNAGLRTVETIRSPGDKAMFYAFQGNYAGREPNSAPFLTEDLQAIIKLTNFGRRGLYDAQRQVIRDGAADYQFIPDNPIDRAWFPRTAQAPNPVDPVPPGTNIVKAIRDAYDALINCPDSASKAIIMASDGISTCTFGTGNGAEGFADDDPIPAPDCSIPSESNIYQSRYLPSEEHLIGDVLETLRANGISFTLLLDSASANANFRNVQQGEAWLTPADALTSGTYCTGLPETCSAGETPFFDLSPSYDTDAFNSWASDCNPPQDCSPDRFVFENRNDPDVRFSRPMGSLFHLAAETGGVICPIMPSCNDTEAGFPSPPPQNGPLGWYWDHDGLPNTAAVLRDDSRTNVELVPDGFLRCAPLLLNRAEQAISCVLGAIGGNPFQNVDEVPAP